MQTSVHGQQKIEQREGVVLKAYRDQRGIPTIGVGHTSAAGPPHVQMGMVISRDEAGQIRRFLNVYVNEEDIRFLGGNAYAFRDGDEVLLVPSIAGG